MSDKFSLTPFIDRYKGGYFSNNLAEFNLILPMNHQQQINIQNTVFEINNDSLKKRIIKRTAPILFSTISAAVASYLNYLVFYNVSNSAKAGSLEYSFGGRIISSIGMLFALINNNYLFSDVVDLGTDYLISAGILSCYIAAGRTDIGKGFFVSFGIINLFRMAMIARNMANRFFSKKIF